MPHAMHLGDSPPVYRIDLSLPPAERYIEVAKAYRNHLISITGIFDELVIEALPKRFLPWITRMARLMLRRLYSREETDEIRGISEATGIEMYLLVSFNVLLDLLMGCTSGAALTKPDTTEGLRPRLLHFRTLDWDMDELRKLLVCFEYVRGPDYTTVLATNITYVGFVGVLTGVRKGLSVSLNFRPNHDTSSWLRNYRYYGSHLLVLLGYRRSISSILRQYIIPSDDSSALPLSQVWPIVMRTPSTAAYLIFCDGIEAIVMEKDHRTAHVARHSSFIVATNNDHITPTPLKEEKRNKINQRADLVVGSPLSVEDLIQDSNERRALMDAYWEKKSKQAKKLNSSTRTCSTARRDPLKRTRSSRKDCGESTGIAQTTISDSQTAIEVTATPKEVIEWTTTYPITNEMTHFAAIMDPRKGKVVWIRRFLEPLRSFSVD
ncbi:beta subunit of N-acylethanolamine-hydrolyzing acid amidase-domain-containing protein [Aspergillus avenaceus]|uniref:ceramidase n=1 Tax=Aspergillus avenaceus TaxID=36643 RepID=A0A5N6U6T2_ASPAV|nr:beta subunit of N-acylethanolamine-hydrolyzing acid amidase-domain-containing protein [Aspergillus avenaceus]